MCCRYGWESFKLDFRIGFFLGIVLCIDFIFIGMEKRKCLGYNSRSYGSGFSWFVGCYLFLMEEKVFFCLG